MKKDPDKIAAIEKAMAKKYGIESVQNPKANWNEDKEKEYIEQLKKFDEKHYRASLTSDKVEVNGVFVSKAFMGDDFDEIKKLAKTLFKDVKFFKPVSCRNESKETYIHCKILKTL